MTQLKKWNPATSTWDPVIVGARGEGVPPAGTTNQILRKKSNTDYDVEWATVAVSPEIAQDTDGTPYLV